MKKAVMYGAGNIGRGFIGQLLSQSGYEVVFIDVNKAVVNKLNEDRCYPIKFVADTGNHEIMVEPVRAVDGRDNDLIAKEISGVDVMATAVGVNVLPYIAKKIAQGLTKRWAGENDQPMNIIICENLMNANLYLKSLIEKELHPKDRNKLEALVGFVEASIGRMVPVTTSKMQEGNILRVCVEDYELLPVDKASFRGEIPAIKNMVPYTPFDYYIKRKLFVHNMGHAIAAYLGFQKGFNYIWEAIEDKEIQAICRGAMLESSKALSKTISVPFGELEVYVEDLINRFKNRQLGDTVERVGRDLKRKLSPTDRLIGALNLCQETNSKSICICIGIAAALGYKDSMKSPVQQLIDQRRVEEVMETVCCIARGTKAWNDIKSAIYVDEITS